MRFHYSLFVDDTFWIDGLPQLLRTDPIVLPDCRVATAKQFAEWFCGCNIRSVVKMGDSLEPNLKVARIRNTLEPFVDFSQQIIDFDLVADIADQLADYSHRNGIDPRVIDCHVDN